MPTDVLDAFMEKDAVDTVEQMRSKLAAMQEKLDVEVKRAELATMEKDNMERRLEMKAEPVSPGREYLSASVASTQIMRVVEHWIRHRDLEEVNVRQTGLTDESFATLVHVLQQSPSLSSIDLSDNELTNASVSDIAQILTSVSDLQMLTVARNHMPLGALGYFMTAMLERQAQDFEPPVLINFTDNQGLLVEENHGQEAIAMQDRCSTLCNLKVSLRAANLLVTVSNTLWKFLVDTGHPLLPADCSSPNWGELDETTHGKLLEALRPIVVYEEQVNGEPRSISAWIAVAAPRPEKEDKEEPEEPAEVPTVTMSMDYAAVEMPYQEPEPLKPKVSTIEEARQSIEQPVQERDTQLVQKRAEKSKTFNIKQIVTKNGMILMNILDRMLETTAIDATDVETDRTLLEYSAMTGNMSLAKLCFRRGMNMSALTKDGNTAFNIATKRKDYQMMEFLHMYGVKVNSADAEGRTALHVATSNNDIDGICRLIEWGSDINLKNHKKQTPLHFAAMGGYMDVAMLLLELSAELNAKDEKNFTAVAHAEATDHFELMDRLVQLGGKHASEVMDRSHIGDKIGKLTQPKFMRKSTSLTRMQKLPVSLP
jgi:ankyrin repeat protein